MNIPPVYHRLTLAVVRMVDQGHHRSAALRGALKNLPTALQRVDNAVFPVFERAWLHKMAVLDESTHVKPLAEQFMGDLARGTRNEHARLMDIFKRAVLQTVEPSQEFALRFMECLDGLRATAGHQQSHVNAVWEYFVGAADALDGIRLADFEASFSRDATSC